MSPGRVERTEERVFVAARDATLVGEVNTAIDRSTSPRFARPSWQRLFKYKLSDNWSMHMRLGVLNVGRLWWCVYFDCRFRFAVRCGHFGPREAFLGRFLPLC